MANSLLAPPAGSRSIAVLQAHPPGCPCGTCPGSLGGLMTGVTGGTSLITIGTSDRVERTYAPASMHGLADSLGLSESAQTGLYQHAIFSCPEESEAVYDDILLRLGSESDADRVKTVTQLNAEYVGS